MLGHATKLRPVLKTLQNVFSDGLVRLLPTRLRHIMSLSLLTATQWIYGYYCSLSLQAGFQMDTCGEFICVIMYTNMLENARTHPGHVDELGTLVGLFQSF